MKKKFLSLFLAAVCITGAMSLTACDKGNDENSDNANGGNQINTEDPNGTTGSNKPDTLFGKPAIPNGVSLQTVEPANAMDEYNRIYESVNDDPHIYFSVYNNEKSHMEGFDEEYYDYDTDKTYPDLNYTRDTELTTYTNSGYILNDEKPLIGAAEYDIVSENENYDKVEELNAERKYAITSSTLLADNYLYHILDDKLVEYTDAKSTGLLNQMENEMTALSMITSGNHPIYRGANDLHSASKAISKAIKYEELKDTDPDTAKRNIVSITWNIDIETAPEYKDIKLENYVLETKSSADKFYASLKYKISFTIIPTWQNDGKDYENVTVENEIILYLDKNAEIDKDKIPTGTKVKPENFKTELTKNILIVDGDGEKIFQDIKDGKTVTLDVYGGGKAENLVLYVNGFKYTPVDNKITIDGSELKNLYKRSEVKIYSEYDDEVENLYCRSRLLYYKR